MKFCFGHTPKHSLPSTGINNLVYLFCTCLKQAKKTTGNNFHLHYIFSLPGIIFPDLILPPSLKKNQFEQ